MRLTQRQVQALWRQAYISGQSGGRWYLSAHEPLSKEEMIDLEARLYVAAHPELVQHVIELDVEDEPHKENPACPHCDEFWPGHDPLCGDPINYLNQEEMS